MILYQKISSDAKKSINGDDVNKFQPETVWDSTNHNNITNNHQLPPSYFKKISYHVRLIVLIQRPPKKSTVPLMTACISGKARRTSLLPITDNLKSTSIK